MKIKTLVFLLLHSTFIFKLLGGIYPTIQTANELKLECYKPFYPFESSRIDNKIKKIISNKNLMNDTLEIFFIHEMAHQTYERCIIYLKRSHKRRLVSDIRFYHSKIILFNRYLHFSKTRNKNILNDSTYLFSRCNKPCYFIDPYRINTHGGSGVYKTIVFKKNKVEDITNYKDFTW